MKRILYAAVVLILLSGCSIPLRKPVPAPISSNNKSETSSDMNNISRVREALMGAETLTVNGKLMVKNPDSALVLVNKNQNLPSDWVPTDLIIPKVAFTFKGEAPRKYMRKEAAQALEELFSQALGDGIKLYAMSGYRSYSTQQRLYNDEVKRSGAKAANKIVALPGQSEHQTGLAMDVSCASMNFSLQESFEDTKEGKWLKEHAKDAGFIIRYPRDKSAVTGYSFEPWHIRYVGKDAANYITTYDITLDEYYSMLAQK